MNPDDLKLIREAGPLTFYARPALDRIPSVIVYGSTGVTSEALAAAIERILNAILDDALRPYPEGK